MKIRPGIFFALLFTFQITIAQNKPKPVESKITEAIIYLQGTQIISEGSAYLVTGQNELVFQGLPNGINPQTIQAAGPKDAVILEVKHYVNYLKPTGKPAELQKLEDSLKFYQKIIDQVNSDKWVIAEEQKMILANQNLRGDHVGLKVEELQKAAEFFRSRLSNIADMNIVYAQKLHDANESSQKIRNQMNSINAKNNTTSNDIVVKVQANREGRHDFLLKYYSDYARWTPRYDIRMDDTKNPAKLDLRADINQTTGVNFEKVKLTLSSGNPGQGGNKPEISPWFIYAYQPQTEKTTGMARTESRSAAPAPAYGQAPEEDKNNGVLKSFDNKTLADFTVVAQGATTVTYEIKLAQDLPSDVQNHQVFIQKYELPAEYQHYALPRLDPDVFLIARVTNWEKYDLLPGIASIYFEGAYVTETTLDPNFTVDTLDLSLGRDKKIAVKREQIKDFYNCKTFGGNKEHSFGYEITIRNTKNEDVNLIFQDQVPVSQNKDMTVKISDETMKPVSGLIPEFDESHGYLTWRLKLKPQESVKLFLKYTVKHPKDLVVQGI